MAEVCCIQVWLPPPDRDWGKGAGAAPWGPGRLRSQSLPHCPSRGAGQAGRGQPVVPTTQLVCGEGAGLQPGQEAHF